MKAVRQSLRRGTVATASSDSRRYAPASIRQRIGPELNMHGTRHRTLAALFDKTLSVRHLTIRAVIQTYSAPRRRPRRPFDWLWRGGLRGLGSQVGTAPPDGSGETGAGARFEQVTTGYGENSRRTRFAWFRHCEDLREGHPHPAFLSAGQG